MKRLFFLFLVLIALIALWQQNEFDFYYVGSHRNIENENDKKTWNIRFVDWTTETEKIFAYSFDLQDSQKSEMVICEIDDLNDHEHKCVVKKGPCEVLDAYLREFHLEICEIPSVRKVNKLKNFIQRHSDYEFKKPTIVVESLSDYCANFIRIEEGNYDNYMINRILNVFYEVRKIYADF